MTTRDKNIVGEVLAKTYRIERFLGAGTVGTVYVARHVRSGGLYAVKVLHRRLAASADVYQRRFAIPTSCRSPTSIAMRAGCRSS